MRQYTLTFSAIPFRFLPAALQGFGIDPENAYWMGAYLTVIWGFIFGEVFVRYLRRSGYGNMEKLSGGSSNDVESELTIISPDSSSNA